MKTENMTFTEALEAMERGEKVRRVNWHDIKYFEKTPRGFANDAGTGIRSFTDEEVCATDWEIYRAEPVLNPCGCGGEAKLIIDKEFDNEECFVVKCKKCGVRTVHCYYESSAINDWNSAHPVAEEPNKEIKVGDFIFFKTIDGKTRCSKVEQIHDDYVVSSFCDVLKKDIIGKAVVTTNAKPKTNFEKHITPEFIYDSITSGHACRQIAKLVFGEGFSCDKQTCDDCASRFYKWAKKTVEASDDKR